ncbi:MAG TPA: SDR family NAD(P)-dependent oxidoreductase [Nevskiaceae bacterium]|nr:SDR family NAD(P)-dependent oxidoreductase [Nevskiaceae bacterium]
MPKRVLLTGGSSGLGHALGRQLGARGYEVIATARDDVQAAALVSDGVCARTVQVDLAIEATIASIPAQLRGQGIDALDAVLHCAAISDAGPLETIPMARVRQMFEVNVFGTFGLIQATADLLRRAKGRLLLTGSIGGFSVWPILGVYGATKHTLEAIADAARRELSPFGVEVALIRPGGIRTRMLSRHLEDMNARVAALDGADREHYGALYRGYVERLTRTGHLAATPDAMASRLVAVLESRRMRTSYCFGIDCKALRVIDLVLPDRIFDVMIRKLFPA